MSDEQCLQERFWEFFVQNRRDLLVFAGRHATSDYPAEDLVGEAFVIASERLDSAKCDKWLAWLRRIIIRLRIDWYRRRVRAPVVLAGDITTTENADFIDSVGGETLWPWELVERRSRKSGGRGATSGETLSPSELVERFGDAEIVRQALARMQNEQQRCVLELVLDNFAADGDPNLKKVAKDLTISHSNAKQLYQRAREALKHSLRQLAKEMNISTERPNHEP